VKKFWPLALCLMGLVGGGSLIQTPTTANAAVHYIHKWQHPYPIDLLNYREDTGKPNLAGVYSSKGKLLRRVNGSKVTANYWPLAEAKINGRKYYRVYKYSYRANHEGTHKLVGWMRTSAFGQQPGSVAYASAMFYTYSANFGDSDLPKAMWINEILGQPIKFQAENAGHSFSFVTSADFVLRSYERESDGNYSYTGVAASRYTNHELELAYSSQKKGEHSVVKHIKNGRTQHYTIYDNKYGNVPTTIKNNVKGKWLTYSYKLKGKKHTYTITSKGVTRFDGQKLKYTVESNEG